MPPLHKLGFSLVNQPIDLSGQHFVLNNDQSINQSTINKPINKPCFICLQSLQLPDTIHVLSVYNPFTLNKPCFICLQSLHLKQTMFYLFTTPSPDTIHVLSVYNPLNYLIQSMFYLLIFQDLLFDKLQV